MNLVATMTAPHYTDYQLPGLKCDPLGTISAMMLNSFAYSGKWNNRRLEHTFHGIWQLIFNALIHDIRPVMQALPQFRLESKNDGPLPATLADSSFSTQAGGAEEKIPDFVLVLLDVVKREGIAIANDFPQFLDWRIFKLRAIETPLLCDLKRPGPRSNARVEEYRNEVEILQHTAQVSLEEDAPIVFAMQPNLEKVILVGTCGDWWTWRVLTRAQCRTDNFMDVEDGVKRPDLESSDSDGSRGNSVLYHPSSSLPRKAKELRRDFHREGSVLEPPASAEDASTIPYSRRGTSQKKRGKKRFYLHRNLGPPYMQLELPTVDIDLVEQERTASWSNNILYGTRVSNQQFYVIHQLLERRTIDLKKGWNFWENIGKEEDNDKEAGDNSGSVEFFDGSDLTDSDEDEDEDVEYEYE